MVYKTQETAPFNAAVATLMRIDSIINQLGITSMAMAQGITPEGNGLLMRFNLLQQLFIQSCPLLTEKDEAELKPKVMNLLRPQRRRTTDNYGNITSNEIMYDSKLDMQINELEMEIENALQAEGYFMPSKADPKYSWGKR